MERHSQVEHQDNFFIEKRKNEVEKNKKQIRAGSRTTATSKMEHFVIIVNGWKPNYYHKELHLGCCSSPRSASANDNENLQLVI